MRPAAIWKRLIDDWEHQILRPILVSMMTAIVLVAGSLVFTPVRRFLFAPEERSDYPLFCTAEPIVEDGPSGKRLVVAFFVVNKTGDEQTVETLRQFLRTHLRDSEQSSPTINLRYYRRTGQINAAYSDRAFNDDKGDLAVSTEDSMVHIVPERLAPRAIVRVGIEVTGLPVLEGITRATRTSVPFDNLELYERACYTR